MTGSAPAVPVIDIGRSDRTVGADRIDRADIAGKIDGACREFGFFQAAGHGIDPAVIEAMAAALDEFWAWSVAAKEAFVPDDPTVNRGYARLGSEALAYSLGTATAPDWFEAFNTGPEPDPDNPVHRLNPHNFFSPTPWPEIDGFRRALMAYLDEATALAHHLTSLFALALDLEPDFFVSRTDHSTDAMRCIHYPPLADSLPRLGMGAHTDYGIVTVLWADRAPGLEIVGPDGQWRPVLPEPDTLLVNLGDLLAEWTNDRWRSTLHRVVPPAPGHRRRSVAFFHDGNYDAVVECLPSCTSTENPPRYEPVIAGEHLIAKLMGPRTMTASSAESTAGDRLPRADE